MRILRNYLEFYLSHEILQMSIDSLLHSPALNTGFIFNPGIPALVDDVVCRL